MADDTFEIALQVTGEDRAARAFENLKLRELEARDEAAKLAAELRRLQQSGTASAEQIEAAARALIRARQGAAEYAMQARRVQQAIRAQTQETARLAQAQTVQTATAARATTVAGAQAASVVALGSRWGQLAGAIGNVGSVVGTAVPLMGRMGSTIGAVGTASTALTGALGPLGVAVGAITTVVGIASAAWMAYSESTRDAERATVDATLASEEAAIARMEASILESQVRLNRLRTDGSDEDFRREQANLRALRGSLESMLEPVRQRRDLSRQLTEETQRRARAQEEENRAAQENSRVMAEINATMAEIQERENRRKAAAQAWASATRDATAEEVRIFRESRAEMLRIEIETNRSTIDAFREYLSERRAMQAAENAWYRQELAQNAADERRVNADIAQGIRELEETERQRQQVREQLARNDQQRRLAELEAYNERQKELGAITSGMWDSIGGTVTDAAGQMFKFVIEGAEGGGDAFLAMLDQFLEATSIQYTIKALAEVAEAVAAAARYDYAAAAQHGIAAGLAAGVAAATGLASAAISVPTAATGGGAGAASPAAPAGPPGGNTNVTIQLYAPQAVFTEAERAELLARGFREAERVRPGSARI